MHQNLRPGHRAASAAFEQYSESDQRKGDEAMDGLKEPNDFAANEVDVGPWPWRAPEKTGLAFLKPCGGPGVLHVRNVRAAATSVNSCEE